MKQIQVLNRKIAPNNKPRWCWPKLYGVAGLYPQGRREQSPICAENFGKIPKGGGGKAKPCCLVGLAPNFDIFWLLKKDKIMFTLSIPQRQIGIWTGLRDLHPTPPPPHPTPQTQSFLIHCHPSYIFWLPTPKMCAFHLFLERLPKPVFLRQSLPDTAVDQGNFLKNTAHCHEGWGWAAVSIKT